MSVTPENFYQECVERSWRTVDLALTSSGEKPLSDAEKVRVELGIAAGITSTFGVLQESGVIGGEQP